MTLAALLAAAAAARGAVVQEATLTAPDAPPATDFGYSIAMTDDTVVVGAPGAPNAAGLTHGAVYVFTRAGTSWSQQARLTTSGGSDDALGSAVAMSGDTVAAGVRGDNGDAGAVVVFVRNGASWSERAHLSGGAADEDFGLALRIDGDTIVVGSPEEAVGANDHQGVAYVFVRAGASWTLQAKLVASDGVALDELGFAVALDGDTAIVTSAQHDAQRGAAYVFVRSGTNWVEQAKLVASDAQPGDKLGDLFSSSLTGDTAVISAASVDQLRGAAYVFVRSGALWTEQAKLVAADRAAFDEFGDAVALSGTTVLVGADGDDSPSSSQHGAAYVYQRTGSQWQQAAKLSAADGTEPELFGVSVAASAQRFGVAALGNPNVPNGATGTVYVYRQTAPATVPALFPLGGVSMLGTLLALLIVRVRRAASGPRTS